MTFVICAVFLLQTNPEAVLVSGHLDKWPLLTDVTEQSTGVQSWDSEGRRRVIRLILSAGLDFVLTVCHTQTEGSGGPAMRKIWQS